MEVRHKKALNSQFVTLAEEINPEYIFPYLIEDGILTPHMALIISTGGTVYDKANRLLSVLPSRGPGAFGSFLRALGVYYPWLKDGLIAAVNTGDEHHARRTQEGTDQCTLTTFGQSRPDLYFTVHDTGRNFYQANVGRHHVEVDTTRQGGPFSRYFANERAKRIQILSQCLGKNEFVVEIDNTQLYQPQPTPKSSQPTSSNAPSAAGMTTQMASLSVSVQSDSERVTEQQLMFVAEKMNGDWESQAIRLGFQSADVARFKNDNNGMIMQIHAMLRAWRTKKGPDATCERLKQELKDAGVDLDAYGLL
ncbi:uncharacterized protein LOC102806578 [Saccoglossus kowalevskii]